MDAQTQTLVVAAASAACATSLIVCAFDCYYRRQHTAVYGQPQQREGRGPKLRIKIAGRSQGATATRAADAESSPRAPAQLPISPPREGGRAPRNERSKANILNVGVQMAQPSPLATSTASLYSDDLLRERSTTPVYTPSGSGTVASFI